MFAQMNAIGLNMSHYLNSAIPPTTPNATEFQRLECAYPITVSTMEGDVPSEEDTAAFEAWKEESLKKGEKELREKGYDGSFVLASVNPVPGSEPIAKPGRPMAEGGIVGGSGSEKDNVKSEGIEKTKYQPTATDEEDEATASGSEEKSSKEAEASQGTSTLGVPHYFSLTDDRKHPPMEDTVAFIE
jgi:hypothetical protein